MSKPADAPAKTGQVQPPEKVSSTPAPAAAESKSGAAPAAKKANAATAAKKSVTSTSARKAKAPAAKKSVTAASAKKTKAPVAAKVKPESAKSTKKSAVPAKKSVKTVVRRPVAAPSPAAAQAAAAPRAESAMSGVEDAKAPEAVEPQPEPKARFTVEDDGAASARDLFLNAKSAILINMTTGQVYYEHNADRTIQPASITKLLTLYLIREAMAEGRISSATPIPVSSQAVMTGGSRMRLKRGEKVPLSELIKGISVVSANNACVAVAEFMGDGDPTKFVSQMNDKARKIGMTSSRFRNPSGLPDKGQLSTARDIAKLSMSYLHAFPESLQIHSMTTHTFHGSTHHNANSLLRTYKGADGLKTGFVCDAGYNITATAKRGNTRLLAVVLGAQNAAIRQRETAKLLDFGFKRVERENGLGNRAETPAGKPKA